MSNRDPDALYQRAEQAIPFAVEQYLRVRLHTAIPANVVEYVAETKRAKVLPSLRRLLAPTQADPRTEMPRALLVNVPVVHPSGGGYVVHVPLAPGDAVMLVFSERGLEAFKRTFDLANPPVERFFDEVDAVAFPGFGALEIVPASSGLTVQTEDGETSMSVEVDRIEHRIRDEASIVVTPGEISLRAPHVQIRTSRMDVDDY